MRRCTLAFTCVRNTEELSSLTSLTYLEFSEWGWTVPIAETHYPPPPHPPPKKNTGCILGNCRVLIKVPRKMSLDPQTPPKRRFLQGRTEKGGSRTFLLLGTHKPSLPSPSQSWQSPWENQGLISQTATSRKMGTWAESPGPEVRHWLQVLLYHQSQADHPLSGSEFLNPSRELTTQIITSFLADIPGF